MVCDSTEWGRGMVERKARERKVPHHDAADAYVTRSLNVAFEGAR